MQGSFAVSRVGRLNKQMISSCSIDDMSDCFGLIWFTQWKRSQWGRIKHDQDEIW